MDEVEALLQQLDKAYQENDQKTKEALLMKMGNTLFSTKDFNQSIQFYTKASAFASEVRDQNGESIALNNLGKVYTKLGQPHLAIGYHEHALSIARQIGDLKLECNILNDLG